MELFTYICIKMKVMEANEVVPLVRLFLTGNIYADQIMKDVQYLRF